MNMTEPTPDPTQVAPRGSAVTTMVGLDNRFCPGCKKSVIDETGGLVVAFGQSFFHVECFTCAKCYNQVTADTNLLLLSDGSPICAHCSYNCNVCHEPILDEAIMTGDDSYHAHCFKCKVCSNRIDELIFAKTSHGVYCMKCHNERMAKIRKHAQKKREREKAAVGSNSSATREQEARDFHKELTTSSTSLYSSSIRSRASSTTFHEDNENTKFSDAPQTSPRQRTSLPVVDNAPEKAHRDSSRSLSIRNATNATPLQSSSDSKQDPQSFSVTIAPPDNESRNPPLRPNIAGSIPLPRQNSQSSLGYLRGSSPEGESVQRKPSTIGRGGSLDKKNANDNPRRPDLSLRNGNANHQHQLENGKQTSNSLNVPGGTTSRIDKRRSIIPIPPLKLSNPSSTSTPSNQTVGMVRSQTAPAYLNGFPSSSSSSSQVPDSASSEGQGSNDSLVLDDAVSTFIAPALPPIRFSMTGTDFSDLFKSVGGLSSLKSLDNISQEDGGKQARFSSGNLDLSFDLNKTAYTLTTISEDFTDGISDARAPANTPLVTLNGQEAKGSQTLDIPADLLSNDAGKTSGLSRQLSTHEHAESVPLSSPHCNGTGTQILDSNVSLNINPLVTSPESTEHKPLPNGNSAPVLQSSAEDVSERGLGARVTFTSPESADFKRLPSDNYDLVFRRLQEALADASERGSQKLKFDKPFIDAILAVMEQRQHEVEELRRKYDGTKRASQKYIVGLTVAQEEYDQELQARRIAEAEVIRLRVLLSGQAAKITALNGETKRQEARQQVSQELSSNLSKLESDLSKLKVERDMTLAEVEELSISKSTGEVPTKMSRSLTMRLDNIKTQYQHELIPLTQQRETLCREIAELKASRDHFLEETTVLNARNEELAQLNAQYARRVEASLPETPRVEGNAIKEEQTFQGEKSVSFDRNRPQPELPTSLPSSTISTTSTSTLIEENEAKGVKIQRSDTPEMASSSRPKPFIKWPGPKGRDPAYVLQEKGRGRLEHVFHQASVLRFTRCDHCSDKLWGSQLRCSGCHISIHARCINHVQPTCSQQRHPPVPEELTQIDPLPPSLFGRELTEQVKADSKWGERKVPIIVEKCIDAVEASALDYEGIYRKNGGSGQSKAITQLFERGDYLAFDLRDSDRFNDICSVTSVLKAYLRSLPVPLLTFDLYEEFIKATSTKDSVTKTKGLREVVNKLPVEHHQTLRLLMLHLHRVRNNSDKNLMNARNLGVVFGPTLMRSRDPGSEFADMAGKALSIEWLVDNAPSIFQAPT